MGDLTGQPALTCTQSGAVLELPERELFFPCAHCATALFLDRSGVVFYYTVARSLDTESAEQTLRRWMAGDETAKDLDRDAEIEEPSLRCWPLWRLTVQEEAEEGAGLSVRSEPAVVTALGPFKDLGIPPGELRFYDSELAPLLVRPTVSYEAAVNRATLQGAALVHVPPCFFRYTYLGRSYRAVADAVSGQVLCEHYPRRKGRAYLFTAALAFLLFSLATFAAYPVMVTSGMVWVGKGGVW